MADHIDDIATLIETDPRAVLLDILGCAAIVVTVIAGLHLAALF